MGAEPFVVSGDASGQQANLRWRGERTSTTATGGAGALGHVRRGAREALQENPFARKTSQHSTMKVIIDTIYK